MYFRVSGKCNERHRKEKQITKSKKKHTILSGITISENSHQNLTFYNTQINVENLKEQPLSDHKNTMKKTLYFCVFFLFLHRQKLIRLQMNRIKEVLKEKVSHKLGLPKNWTRAITR